jgi:hypothetical protein
MQRRLPTHLTTSAWVSSARHCRRGRVGLRVRAPAPGPARQSRYVRPELRCPMPTVLYMVTSKSSVAPVQPRGTLGDPEVPCCFSNCMERTRLTRSTRRLATRTKSAAATRPTNSLPYRPSRRSMLRRTGGLALGPAEAQPDHLRGDHHDPSQQLEVSRRWRIRANGREPAPRRARRADWRDDDANHA